MSAKFWFMLMRLRERLWIRPLVVCALSLVAVFVAGAADGLAVAEFILDVSADTIETLLKILSASMLVIATFAVGSMVSSYATAASTATPRAFTLVVADDVSQNALSSFIGAFIYSIVALVALMNGYYGKTGRFALFLLTLAVFAGVIFTFVRWMDCIARLGRMGTTIDKVEAATATAMKRRKRAPSLGGGEPGERNEQDREIVSDSIGYLRRIDVDRLQAIAEEFSASIAIEALPGTFVAPDQVLARVSRDSSESVEIDAERVADAFLIGNDRTFEEDPRFGLVVLAEIAGRALSPAVNDPGTAIDIIGTLVRLFALWGAPLAEDEVEPRAYDRVTAPRLSVDDMFDDAFTAIARDGAGSVEVAIRLQKALRSLASLPDPAIKRAAVEHSRRAFDRAANSLSLPDDLAALKRAMVGES